MQNLLTQILEIIVIYHIIALVLNFTHQVYTKINTPQIEAELEAAQVFDTGVKAIMATEVEEPAVTEPVIMVKATKHKVNQVAKKPKPELNTVAAMREYIKSDRERREKIEAFLNNKYYHAKKADLIRAIEAIG
jgi:hypothetical protein